MAESSVDKFKATVKPILEHKNAYNSYKSFTEGGVPQDERMENITAVNKALKTGLDVPMAVLGSAWNIPFGKTGWRYGKDNWILQSKADKAQRKSELDNYKLYRERRDRVRDDILEIATAGKKKYEETGDEKFLNIATQGINDMLGAEGLTPENDYVIVTPEMRDMRDGIGLFTNNPNPYPTIEAAGYIGGGIYGAVKSAGQPGGTFNMFRQ